jgi:hypothetical protein
LDKVSFLSNPVKILSAAYSKCLRVIDLLDTLAALIAASLHKLAKSAPENPGVITATFFAYSSKLIV